MNAPKVQKPKKRTYCLIKCIGAKFLSSKVQILFKKKFDVIDSSIPNIVACIYQMFGIKFVSRREAL